MGRPLLHPFGMGHAAVVFDGDDSRVAIALTTSGRLMEMPVARVRRWPPSTEKSAIGDGDQRVGS